MLNQSGIYQIFNIANGKRYIGSAVCFNKRWSIHKHKIKTLKHHSRHLQSAWNKYGEESFKFEIIELCEKEKLIEREQYYIDTLNPEYNTAKIAGNTLGTKRNEASKMLMSDSAKGHKRWLGKHHTEETRKRISESHKGKVLSEKTKEKLRIFNTGKVMSQEAIEKSASKRKGQKPTSECIARCYLMIENNKGRKHSEKSKINMSIAQKKKILSDEARANISKATTLRNKARIVSDETKALMSKSRTGKVFSEETKLKMSISAKLAKQNKRELKEILSVWSVAI